MYGKRTLGVLCSLTVWLTKVPKNTLVRLVDFPCAPRHALRVKELGLRPGTTFHVTQHAGFGGVVINVAGSRIAVDHGSARRMEVEPLEVEA